MRNGVARGQPRCRHAAVFDHGPIADPGHDLTLYMTLALSGFLLAQRPSREPGARGRRGCCSPGRPAGLGVPHQGLVAVAIPGAVLDSVQRAFARLRTMAAPAVGSGLPLFLAITVPWHWLAARRLPDFLDFFFVREHVARYLTPIAT